MVLAGLASVIVAAVPASAADDSAAECQSQDTERRIAGCTDLLLQPGLHPEAAAAAYSLRALAYQVKGLNEAALRDYDRSLALKSKFAGRAQQPRLGAGQIWPATRWRQ